MYFIGTCIAFESFSDSKGAVNATVRFERPVLGGNLKNTISEIQMFDKSPLEFTCSLSRSNRPKIVTLKLLDNESWMGRILLIEPGFILLN